MVTRCGCAARAVAGGYGGGGGAGGGGGGRPRPVAVKREEHIAQRPCMYVYVHTRLAQTAVRTRNTRAACTREPPRTTPPTINTTHDTTQAQHDTTTPRTHNARHAQHCVLTARIIARTFRSARNSTHARQHVLQHAHHYTGTSARTHERARHSMHQSTRAS